VHNHNRTQRAGTYPTDTSRVHTAWRQNLMNGVMQKAGEKAIDKTIK